MSDEIKCICCLDDVLKRKKYFSCTTCTQTFIDNRCMFELKQHRETCPTCNQINLKDFRFHLNENPKPIEIVKLQPMQKKSCPNCEKSFGNINEHLKFCKFGSCPFCQKSKVCYKHIMNCDPLFKSLLTTNHLPHLLKSNGLFQTLKCGSIIEIFLTDEFRKGFFRRKSLLESNKEFAHVVEAKVLEIDQNKITILDLWFCRKVSLNLNENITRLLIAPKNCYLPDWRNMLKPTSFSRNLFQNLFQKYKALKHSVIEHVEKNENKINLSIGYIIDISSDDSTQLLVDFGSKGLIYVDRHADNIRPCGLEPKLNESIEVLYDSLA